MIGIGNNKMEQQLKITPENFLTIKQDVEIVLQERLGSLGSAIVKGE